MKPVVANPSASFGQLLDGLKVLEEEKQIGYQINQIIAKLQRKKRKLDGKTMEHFVSMTGGMDPTQFIQQLEQEPPQQARNRILAHRDLFELLGETRANDCCSVIIYDMPDKLVSHTRGYGTGSRPEDFLDAFADYVKTHINEIAVLNIVCTRPKELTRASLKDLRLTLDREGFTTKHSTPLFRNWPTRR